MRAELLARETESRDCVGIPTLPAIHFVRGRTEISLLPRPEATLFFFSLSRYNVEFSFVLFMKHTTKS